MKYILFGILWFIFMLINLPMIIIMGLISLWYWDVEYLDKFGENLACSMDHLLEKKRDIIK